MFQLYQLLPFAIKFYNMELNAIYLISGKHLFEDKLCSNCSEINQLILLSN